MFKKEIKLELFLYLLKQTAEVRVETVTSSSSKSDLFIWNIFLQLIGIQLSLSR